MFVTQGPVAPESRLFVGREAELQRMQKWLSPVMCVGTVLGARQTGKTSLLLKLRHAIQDKHACVFIDLQGAEGANVEQCFGYIAEEIVTQLAERNTDGLPIPKDGRSFLAFLQHVSRTFQTIRVVIILDEFGSLPVETAIKLAHTIRAAFTNRLVKQEYARYFFLLAGATDMLLLTTGRNSPLKNVTESIYLGDLSLVETTQLLEEGFGTRSTQLSPAINSCLYDWSGGHPYWTQLLASSLADQSQPLTEQSVRNIVELLLQTEDKNLPHVLRALEKRDEMLFKTVESLLNGKSVPFSRSNSSVAELELIGLVKNLSGHCAIRNKVYEEAIQRQRKTQPVLPAQPQVTEPLQGTPSTIDLTSKELRSGDSIGPYRLVRMLGSGQFGVVWLAHRQTPIATTTCAIKVPKAQHVDIDLIKHEASVWAHASGHPNVLPIVEANVYEGQAVIVSEFAPDGSLAEWLFRHSDSMPSIESSVDMALGILSGLEHLHRRRIVHRDLKPANILLQGETPRLADFGLSRVLKSSTESGKILGTPAYMAPEAFNGTRNEQTDIWSAGVILYQLLSGSLPFPQSDVNSLVAAIVRNDPAPLPRSVTIFLREVVATALQKTPALRYESAAKMREALRDVARHL